MYKTKLQELCQRRSWDLPDYATAKDGPDHMPRFTATVTVQGQLFHTPDHCKSSKDAQNTAARVAFEHLTSSDPLPTPPNAPPHSQMQPLSVAADPPPLALSPLTSSDPLPTPPNVPPHSQMQPLSVAADPPPLPLSPLPSSLPNPTPGIHFLYKFHKLLEIRVMWACFFLCDYLFHGFWIRNVAGYDKCDVY